MCLNRLRLGHHRRLACITSFSYTWMQWDLTDKWYSKVFTYFLATSSAKEIYLLIAVWALKVAHVFNDTNNWYVELVEHSDGLNCNVHCNVLRSCDYKDTRYRYRLSNSKRSVACAWRQ